jgi:chromosome segregation ATPase
MKNQLGLIVLIVVCVGLIVALVVNQKKATELRTADASTIGNISNELVNTTGKLEEASKVNMDLNKDLDTRRTELMGMTNRLNEVSGTLAKTEDVLKSTQEQMARDVAQRDARISELESQNHALDQRALDLTTAITNLTGQIDDTQKKLAASEGDKAFLQKELQRLMTEKAELEKQFNDLKVLRAQVSKLQEELTISRRLDWIRRGLFARDEKKGAQLLMEKNPPVPRSSASTNAQPKPGRYDLNVEVNSDGTVRVLPPPTNAPAGTQP